VRGREAGRRGRTLSHPSPLFGLLYGSNAPTDYTYVLVVTVSLLGWGGEYKIDGSLSSGRAVQWGGISGGASARRGWLRARSFFSPCRMFWTLTDGRSIRRQPPSIRTCTTGRRAFRPKSQPLHHYMRAKRRDETRRSARHRELVIRCAFFFSLYYKVYRSHARTRRMHNGLRVYCCMHARSGSIDAAVLSSNCRARARWKIISHESLSVPKKQCDESPASML
jgi:hypothetical protein